MGKIKNVLSLFDGMSCLQVALSRSDISYDKYYASEIDKYAMQVTQSNHPDTIQVGDITKWKKWCIDWSSIDLVTGGFPCQSWSLAGKQLGDKDERGMLFWTMLDVIKKVLENNPKAKFLVENVRMKKEFEEYITKHTEDALGNVNKTLINSALVSAQNRNRYYWSNIDGVEQPADKGIILGDILEKNQILSRPCEIKKFSINSLCHHIANATDIKGNESIKRVYAESGKSPTITSCTGGHREPKILCGAIVGRYRKLTPVECERLQTLPDNYTAGVSNTQRYKMIGNGWTVDVISHILKGVE